MKNIETVTIHEKNTGKYFVFVRKFPGICAQGDSFEEAKKKVQEYYYQFLEVLRGKEVIMREEEVVSM